MKPIKVKANRDAPSCLRSNDVLRLEKLKGRCVDVSGLGMRTVLRVDVGVLSVPRWADQVTGTLYDMDGVCIGNPRFRFTVQA